MAAGIPGLGATPAVVIRPDWLVVTVPVGIKPKTKPHFVMLLGNTVMSISSKVFDGSRPATVNSPHLLMLNSYCLKPICLARQMNCGSERRLS
jgi:hypothetical protein